MEKVFRHFLVNKSDELVESGLSFGLSKDVLEQESFNLQQMEQSVFLGNIDFVKRPKYDKNQNKPEIFRYIVGEVGSRILFEDYLSNPNEAIKTFSNFLDVNAKLDIDEAMQMISNGKFKNYTEAMNGYIQIYKDKLSMLDNKNKTQVVSES